MLTPYLARLKCPVGYTQIGRCALCATEIKLMHTRGISDDIDIHDIRNSR
jgi:hypothetical protein